MTTADAFFYLFSCVAVASAFMVIAARNPVHSVLFLILAFVNAAGLFLLLGAEFLAMILIVVYVGAVAVLFLFVVMMLDVDFAELKQGFLQYLPVGALIGAIVLIELVLVVGAWTVAPARHRHAAARRRPPAISNTAALGRVLYTQYLYFFQAAGFVLLTAMIGAIVLTLRHKTGVKRQNIAAQNVRPHVSVTLQRSSARIVERSIQHSARSAASRTPGPVVRRRTCLCRRNDASRSASRHFLVVAAILFTLGIAGIILNRKNIIVILMSVELILLAVNLNLVAFSAFLHDLTGPGVRPVRADGRGGRVGHRPGHPGRLLPQPRHHRGRRHQHDEGLNAWPMYQLIVFLPLLGFLVAGLFGRQLGARPAELVTTVLVGVSALLSWIAFFHVGFGDRRDRVESPTG